ncbi:MAG TPA: AraC family transcriptional regulator [Candidatus Merdivicinus faecavium]|nr:AraC family transcriptional regulator [Candidatus Merdivicinus faecavium]
MEQDFFKYSYKIANKENLSLNVYNTGYQHCEAGYTWGPATRDHYLIHLVTEGKGRLTVPEGSFEIGPGGLFLIRPGELATYTADPAEPWVYWWVGFNGTEAHRLVHSTSFSDTKRLLYPKNGEQIRRRLLDIYNARGSAPGSEARMLGRLYLFLGELMEQLPAARTTTARQYVDKAAAYISRNFSRDITIAEVADFTGISESYLYRVFSAELGLAPAQFLMRYRVSEAAALLRGSSLTIGEVAASCGFRDPLYFSRVFRRIQGVSPREYARRAVEAKGD